MKVANPTQLDLDRLPLPQQTEAVARMVASHGAHYVAKILEGTPTEYTPLRVGNLSRQLTARLTSSIADFWNRKRHAEAIRTIGTWFMIAAAQDQSESAGQVQTLKFIHKGIEALKGSDLEDLFKMRIALLEKRWAGSIQFDAARWLASSKETISVLGQIGSLGPDASEYPKAHAIARSSMAGLSEAFAAAVTSEGKLDPKQLQLALEQVQSLYALGQRMEKFRVDAPLVRLLSPIEDLKTVLECLVDFARAYPNAVLTA